MKIFKGLAVVVALTCVLGISASAQTQCAPGEVNAPPCLGAPITPDDPAASAEPSESSTSNSAVAVAISEATIDVLLSALSVF
jgi:hypothetical protein